MASCDRARRCSARLRSLIYSPKFFSQFTGARSGPTRRAAAACSPRVTLFTNFTKCDLSHYEFYETANYLLLGTLL